MATSAGLSADERAAVKQRAQELRAQEKAGRNRAAGEEAVRAAIEPLEGSDRDIAEGLYRVVGDVAPHLVPKTYYGMPGFADAAGAMVVFVQPAAKFGTRYATVGFDPAAHLDDGDLWPTSFAVLAWTPDVERRLTGLVRTAAG